MPSPLVHSGVALGLWLAFGLSRWRSAAVVVVAASTPDLDMVLRVFGPEYMRFHHGPTHSLLGSAVLGAATARLADRLRMTRATPRLLGASILATLLHVPLDWSTGEPGSPVHYGVEAFWPLTRQRFIDPTPVFGAFGLDREGFLLHLFTPEALPLYGPELAVGLGAIGIGALVRASTRSIRSRGP
jgi:membrane-bound metal-dependent hydrolase YbcI (DUF457 family)